MLTRKRQSLHRRSSSTIFIRAHYIALLVAMCSVCASSAYAQATNPLSVSVTVTGTVIRDVIGPPPPPPPNPSPNGVPTPSDNGTDRIIFRGQSYPSSKIAILRNGLVFQEEKTKSDGTFEIRALSIKPGTYTFSLRSEDSERSFSNLVTLTVYVAPDIITEIDGIIMSPTITTDLLSVRKGDSILFLGHAIPNTDVTLNIFSPNGVIRNMTANALGVWQYKHDTTPLAIGEYTAKARGKVKDKQTLFSPTVTFSVGTSNKKRPIGTSVVSNRCDLNNDSRVNLLDFSIMAFWYKRPGFPKKVDLNSDSRVNLVDLSILAYCWTG